MITCGVTLKSDAPCEGGPSLERVFAGDRQNPACGFEVLKRDSARAIEIGFGDIKKPLNRSVLGADDNRRKLAKKLRGGPA